MALVHQIDSRLQQIGLNVSWAKKIAYGYRIGLYCGAIIDVFTTGMVAIHGKLNPRDKAERFAQLLEALPSQTTYSRGVVPENAIKSQARGHDDDLLDVAGIWGAADEGQRIAVDPSDSDQMRSLTVFPDFVLNNRGQWMAEEFRQASEDIEDPHEHW